MKKSFFCAACALLILISGLTSQTRAQDEGYKSALGVNVGAIMGVNFKQFVSKRGALDFAFGYDIPKNGLMLTAVYEQHFRMADGLNAYVGGGVNFGLGYMEYFVFGIDPTVGFEYKFAASPVVMALDYTPQINFFGTRCDWSVVALKLRFTL